MTLEYRRHLSSRPSHWSDTLKSTRDTLHVDPRFFGVLVNVKIFDYPIAHEFDLFSFYDRIVFMLNHRNFKVGDHNIMDFLELCLD